jgi:hypothetical protein
MVLICCKNYKQKSLRCDFHLRKSGEDNYSLVYKTDSLMVQNIQEMFWDECVVGTKHENEFKLFIKKDAGLQVVTFNSYEEMEKYYKANISATKSFRLRLPSGYYGILGPEEL